MLVRKWRQWSTCALTVGTQNGAGTVQNSQGLPKNLNVDSPCEPATQILGKYPKHLRRDMSIYLYTNIHSSIMHNSQDMETIQHHQQTNG